MKRKNKTPSIKKLLKALPVLSGFAAVFYLALLVKDIEIPTVLPVENIQVDGELRFLTRQAINDVVKQDITGGYFTVDLSDVRQSLLKMPWVKSVSLRRRWPASLNVLVVEQVPVAYWNSDAYLSEQGDIFKPQAIDQTLNLPALNGPQGQHKNVWKFMNVLYKEIALLDYEVVRLTLDERRAWKMTVIDNITDNEINRKFDVKLGRFDAEHRMQRFVRVLPILMAGDERSGTVSSSNEIDVIDMRYPNGFAVKINKNNNRKNKQRISQGFERVLKTVPELSEV